MPDDPTPPEPSRVTVLLEQLRAGDDPDRAAERLLGLLYEPLRALARRHLARERAGISVQPTLVVHELFERMFAGGAPLPATDRASLLRLASRGMRQILIDHARRRHAHKRGGDLRRLSLTHAPGVDERAYDVLEVDEALTRLAEVDPRAAQVVELKVYGGATNAEIAAALGVGRRTVDRDWTFARSWLRKALEAPDAG